MNEPMPAMDLEEHQEELDKAIDELRGALNGPGMPTMPSMPMADFGDAAPNTSVIMGILVDVQIVLGSAEVPVADLMSLQKGATIPLNRRIGEPVDVIVNGRKIARGEITVLESDPSRFGVRVTEIVSGQSV
ncbi:MAG: flagellar motor switch protein FliN [Rhizobiaceae bacterium]|nr:MAG: flagellar motor switch protein FliN [Rhizobiaceae bacterium]CAG0967261.1 Flagellar motor switch protein FliN [Rhizobiaceae bacterium]